MVTGKALSPMFKRQVLQLTSEVSGDLTEGVPEGVLSGTFAHIISYPESKFFNKRVSIISLLST